MKIEKHKIEELNPAKYNPRKDLKPSDPEYQRIKKSIEEFGYVDSIVWNQRSGNVVSGHQRLKVLKESGLKEVDVSVVDLDDVKEKACNLALNNNPGKWDDEKLEEVLHELELADIDMELTGFDEFDLEEFLGDKKKEGETDPDEVPEEVEPVCKVGDLWQLGEHRLLCGDATKAEDVEKLMAGEKADMVFTDPPYGIGVIKNKTIGGGGPVGGKKNYKKTIGGDNIVKSNKYNPIYMDDKPFDPSVILNIEGKHIIFGGNYFAEKLPVSKGWFVWDKLDGMEGTTKNFSDIEIGWTDFNKPARLFRHRWQGLMKGSERNEKRCHPTQKPVQLLIEIIGYYAPKEMYLILDLFGGSGSTLVACEQTERKCRMMEIDPHYCDVIITRWENFTGAKAVLLNPQTGDQVPA